jgi:hypothetical protein
VGYEIAPAQDFNALFDRYREFKKATHASCHNFGHSFSFIGHIQKDRNSLQAVRNTLITEMNRTETAEAG